MLYLVQLYNSSSTTGLNPQDRVTVLVAAETDADAMKQVHIKATQLSSDDLTYSVKAVVGISLNHVVQLFTLSSEDTLGGKLLRFYD